MAWHRALQKWVWEWMFTDWITPVPPGGGYSMRSITVAWDFRKAAHGQVFRFDYFRFCNTSSPWHSLRNRIREPTLPHALDGH